MSKSTTLKQLILQKEILVLPGAHDALSAKIAQQAGFKAVTMGGYPIAASYLGQPDVGYLTMTEMVDNGKRMAAAIDVPLLCDGDTGYGNALSVMRTVREYEKAGVAGVFFEDQEWPKRCGHMEGKRVIPMAEHCKKIEAAVKAKQDPDFVITARTDARAVNGLEDAIRRGKAYAKAGADLIFIEAPQSLDELKYICAEIKAPKMVNIVEHGKTPSLTAKDFEAMGFAVVVYPLSSLYATAKVLTELYATMLSDGTSKNFEDRMITFAEFNELIGLSEYKKLEEQFLTQETLQAKYGKTHS